VDVARILLEAGSDVETPDNYGQSPLFMACWKGNDLTNIHCVLKLVTAQLAIWYPAIWYHFQMFISYNMAVC